MPMRSAREIRGQAPPGTNGGAEADNVDLSAGDCEMVLSKEEFEMLQTFHRFVPLPALSSRILRIYCEDDLQVPEASADDADDEVEATSSTAASRHRQDVTNRTALNSNVLRHPRRPINLKKKPHYQINLAAQTPKLQQQQEQQHQPSRAPNSTQPDSERPERPEQS